VIAGLFGGDGDDRQVEVTADRFGDGAGRHALFGNGVQHRAGRGVVHGETDEARTVESMHRRPPVAAIVDVAGDALVAGDADQGRDEAVIARTVDSRAKRTIEERTPRVTSDLAAWAPAMRGCTPGSGSSRSVATRPGARPSMPEAMTSGRSLPTRVEPMASIACRSVCAACSMREKSWLYARWTTPWEAAAPVRRLSGSSRPPRWTSAPSAASDPAAAIRIPRRRVPWFSAIVQARG
jgi:hypothetical protein